MHVEFTQVEMGPHAPVESHVWTALPSHSVCPGALLPTHAPPTQAWFEHVKVGVHDDSLPLERHDTCPVQNPAGGAPPSSPVVHGSGWPGYRFGS